MRRPEIAGELIDCLTTCNATWGNVEDCVFGPKYIDSGTALTRISFAEYLLEIAIK